MGPVDWKATGVDTNKFSDSPQLYKHEFKYSVPVVTRNQRNGISICTRYTTEVSCRSSASKCGWCSIGSCHDVKQAASQTICARPYTFRLPLGIEKQQRIGTNIKGVNSLVNNNGIVQRSTYTPQLTSKQFGYAAPNPEFAGLMANRQEALNRQAIPYNNSFPTPTFPHQGTQTVNPQLSSRNCELNLNRFDCLNSPNCGWCHQTTRCTSGNEQGPSFEFCGNEFWEYVLKDLKQHVSFNSDPVQDFGSQDLLSQQLLLEGQGMQPTQTVPVAQPPVSSQSTPLTMSNQPLNLRTDQTNQLYSQAPADPSQQAQQGQQPTTQQSDQQQTQYQPQINQQQLYQQQLQTQQQQYQPQQPQQQQQQYQQQYQQQQTQIQPPTQQTQESSSQLQESPSVNPRPEDMTRFERLKQQNESPTPLQAFKTSMEYPPVEGYRFKESLDDLLREEDTIAPSFTRTEATPPPELEAVPEKHEQQGLDMNNQFKFKQLVTIAKNKLDKQQQLQHQQQEENRAMEEQMSEINPQEDQVRLVQRNPSDAQKQGFLDYLKDAAASILGQKKAEGSGPHQNQEFLKSSQQHKFRQQHRFHQSSIRNPEKTANKNVRMEWDPKVITGILASGEQVAVPKEELNIIMKNLDYGKIGEQVIETLDYE